jgi:hypothetical protein
LCVSFPQQKTENRKKMINYENILKNKVVLNSVIFGIFYFILSLSIDFIDTFKVFFIIFMQFLPGLTFPIFTTYYQKMKTSNITIALHILLSILIYYLNFWIYSYERSFECSPIFAGLIGSLFYQILSKYLLKIETKSVEIIKVAIISGIGFIPTIILNGNGFSIGFAILTWTLINGYLMYKSQMIKLKNEIA